MNIKDFLSESQKNILSEFIKEQTKNALEKQKRETKNPHSVMLEFWEMGYPYEGAIGGSLTYEITPTSLGSVIRAKMYDQVIDLTEYENW